MAEKEPRNQTSYAASRIAVAYALGSTGWLLLSDWWIESLTVEPHAALRLATFRALAFIVATAGLLFWLLRRRRVIGSVSLDDLRNRAADGDRIAEGLAATSAGDRVNLVEAYNALSESEARLRLIVDAAAEAIVIGNEEGVVLTWNHQARRMFGLSEEEAIGEPLADVLAPPWERARCREIVSGAEVNAPPVRLELTGMKRDGSEFPMDVSVIAVAWGQRVLRTAFIRDLTDRVAAARESERMAAIVKASADAIFAVTADGTITSWNPAAERIFGYGATSAHGSPISRLFPAEAKETVQWLLDSITLGIVIETSPLECVRNETEAFSAFLSVSPMWDGDAVSGAAVVVRDASERITMRDRVMDAELLAALGRLAAAVGHQFNNVLMGIQPFLDVLKRNELPAQASRAVESIAKSVDRGKRVASEIQSFTRASEAPKLRSLGVAKWMEGLRGDIELTLGPSIALEVAVEGGDITLAADPIKLRQVFLNLAATARDAMPNGGRLNITVHLAAEPPPRAAASDESSGWAEIVVRDSGEGIDEETQRRIFEPLFAKYRGGSGLELAAVRQIVRSHGGSIDVSSSPGRGTAFRILLPTRAAEPEEKPVVISAGRHEETRRRVLLVEDDTLIAIGLTQALDSHGVHVDVVHTGAQVLRAILAFSPDVVVLDVILPDANGFDIYRAIAAKWPELPVIFSTGHADDFDLRAKEPLHHPHVELLRKPYATEALLASMDRVTAAREELPEVSPEIFSQVSEEQSPRQRR